MLYIMSGFSSSSPAELFITLLLVLKIHFHKLDLEKKSVIGDHVFCWAFLW